MLVFSLHSLPNLVCQLYPSLQRKEKGGPPARKALLASSAGQPSKSEVPEKKDPKRAALKEAVLSQQTPAVKGVAKVPCLLQQWSAAL